MKKENLLILRKSILKDEFGKMSSKQREAIFTVNGTLLILAGAGSGKTTVLINRIANILKYGNAYNSDEFEYEFTEKQMQTLEDCAREVELIVPRIRNKLAVDKAKPWEILAITFTNKAAKELKDRLYNMLGEEADGIWAMTFHSMCARILRRFADRIGYEKSFTIYDTDDQKRVIKECLKALNIDEKTISVKNAISGISKAKDKMITPKQYMIDNENDYYKYKIATIYDLYQKKLKESNAMDFDDIINNTVELFKNNRDVLEIYQNQFKYVMVDEYQDTNKVQYELVKLISGKYKNLCVVGDDDQSIYKFRGATIENILNFEKEFPNTKVIKLEQNYRSTQNILTAANEVIKNNKGRKGKKLWTNVGAGRNINIVTANNEMDEARAIVDNIEAGIKKGRKYSDFAILYRMNAQSNSIEKGLNYAGIPYRIIGGHRFYDRMEVKDMMAYLHVIDNPNDIVRLKRIINTPKRGIGQKTVELIQEIADNIGETMMDVINNCEAYPELSRNYSGINKFSLIIKELSEIEKNDDTTLKDLYEAIVEKTEYEKYLALDKDTYETKLQNIKELATNIVNYERDNENPTLSGFLEETGLITDVDNYDKDSDTVVMMTMHSAKGLEFYSVFLPGFEENIFPGIYKSSDEDELEEERRLCYVAITRARRELSIIHSRVRTMFGRTSASQESSFLAEIPEEITTKIEKGKRIDNPTRPASIITKPPRKPIKPQKITPATHNAISKFSVGDEVSHSKFGKGIVKSAKSMGNDTLLEISFNGIGSKKLMENFANLQNCNN